MNRTTGSSLNSSAPKHPTLRGRYEFKDGGTCEHVFYRDRRVNGYEGEGDDRYFKIIRDL